MKEILIKYDDMDNIEINYELGDIKDTLTVLFMTFNGLLHQICKQDKELLYLSILDAAQKLRESPKINFPQEDAIGEKEKTEV